MKLCDKGINFTYFVLPEYSVYISRCPSLNLLVRVDEVERREVALPTNETDLSQSSRLSLA